MENIKFPVLFTTAVLLAYATLSPWLLSPIVVIIIYCISPFLLVWMVYKVLKDGKPDNKTFDEYFYEHSDITRLPVKEETENPGYFK